MNTSLNSFSRRSEVRVCVSGFEETFAHQQTVAYSIFNSADYAKDELPAESRSR